MSDFREKVFREPDGLQQLMNKIPGYRGYKDKELRREADKLLRDHLAVQFSEQRARLNEIQNRLIRDKDYETVGKIDRAITKLQTLSDRIRTASYGYAGLFDSVKVDENALDRLYQFDASLSSGVDQISTLVNQLDQVTAKKAVEENAIEDAIEALTHELDELNTTFGRRRNAMMGQV